MIALLSLVVAVPLARFVAALRTVVLVQAGLCVVAGVVLVGTSPAHNATRTTGFLLALLLVPLTVIAVAAGRAWRARSTRALDTVG